MTFCIDYLECIMLLSLQYRASYLHTWHLSDCSNLWQQCVQALYSNKPLVITRLQSWPQEMA